MAPGFVHASGLSSASTAGISPAILLNTGSHSGESRYMNM
jgi:hypothetical protein